MPDLTAAQIEKNSANASNPHREEADVTSKPSSKDSWDKADVIGKMVGSLFIPVVVLLAGYWVNIALQKRADQQKTVELAISILQSDKSDKTPELKKWALSVLQNTATSASQTLPPPVLEELRKSPLPGAPVPSAHYDISSSFPVVGSRFTPEQFQGYVSSLDFSSWNHNLWFCTVLISLIWMLGINFPSRIDWRLLQSSMGHRDGRAGRTCL